MSEESKAAAIASLFEVPDEVAIKALEAWMSNEAEVKGLWKLTAEERASVEDAFFAGWIRGYTSRGVAPAYAAN